MFRKKSIHDSHKPKNTLGFRFFNFKNIIKPQPKIDFKKEAVKVRDTVQSVDFRNAYLILIIAIVVIIISLTALSPRDCKTDKNCFNEESKKCVKSKVRFYEDNNLFEYKVIGRQQQFCRINVNLAKANPALSPEDKLKIDEKQMYCKVPFSILSEKGALEMEELSFYCSGPLKEGLLEITTEKLYGVVVSNIGKVALEFQNVLNSTKGIV